MKGDKFSAVWVSHTSISDFLVCPRAYFLKNIYRNPATGHKVKLMSPPLALGQSVHEVIDSIAMLPTDSRMVESLVNRFDVVWQKISGKKGGFVSSESELLYKKRGEEMLRRVMKHPGPINKLAVKIQMDLPYYWLSEESNIILCGKIDWLEYMKKTESVHIIDFKTNLKDENPYSLQLPIYYLLATHCQKRPVSKVSYWYLERSDEPIEQKLPNKTEAHEKILDIAKQIKTARQLSLFKCPYKTGCHACKPFDAILKGRAEFVGTNSYNEDIYILDRSVKQEEESIIL